MLLGIKFQANPTEEQAQILCSWMGAAKFIWNAKCDEDRYLRKYAQKYLPIKTYPKIDQTYSQYKDDELSPFLNECPSQILRNSAANWFESYQLFFKDKERGRPKRKAKGKGMSIHLTRELFEFRKTSQGLKLFIGTKKNNIGLLEVNWHEKKWKRFGYPNSLRVKKLPSGEFTVSFCYGKKEKKKAEKSEREDWFKYLKEHKTKEELEEMVAGIDRGVIVAVASDKKLLNFKKNGMKSLKKQHKKLKRRQKRFVKKAKGSSRRNKLKFKIAKTHEKIANVRENECHHVTKELANSDNKVFILENLKLKNMTKSAKGTKERPGKKVKQKSGLNREILNKCLGKIEIQLKYKARFNNKVVFKINPAYTSQECVNCGHTHSDNRSGIKFKCKLCGNQDHADLNAAKVIKKRAVNLLLDSGTELSDKGVLTPGKDIGRGAYIRPPQRDLGLAEVKNVVKQRKRQKRETELVIT